MSKQYYGIYKAVVEDNNDPLKLNRLRVRVSTVHGVKLGTKSLPWAVPASPILTEPTVPIGTIVYVAFEMGEPDKPIYLGYMLKSANNSQCFKCKRYIGANCCTTFPNGIPTEIFTNDFNHISRYDINNPDEGMFEQK